MNAKTARRFLARNSWRWARFMVFKKEAPSFLRRWRACRAATGDPVFRVFKKS